MASAPAPAVHTAPKGTRTVTVACKFPAGILLQLCREVTYTEETRDGHRERKRWDKVGKSYAVRGPADPNGQTPKGWKRPQTEGGYALTRNIPADFWDEWLKQNKDSPIVQNRVIFACPTHEEAEDISLEQESVISGYEAIEPDTDPRIPRSTSEMVDDIKTGTRG